VKFKIYRTIILPVLYGCETFENRLLRKLFGPKRDKTAVYWRRLANEELHDLSCSPNILVIKPRRKKFVGHVAYGWGGEGHTGFWWVN
jgi:hypothetical protein